MLTTKFDALAHLIIFLKIFQKKQDYAYDNKTCHLKPYTLVRLDSKFFEKSK